MTQYSKIKDFENYVFKIIVLNILDDCNSIMLSVFKYCCKNR